MPSDQTAPAKTRLLLPGAVLLLLAALTALLCLSPWPEQGLTARQGRLHAALDTVSAMRADLYAAAQAQHASVLAETDKDSLRFADEARAALGRAAAGLARLRQGGEPPATELVDAFTRDFDEYRRADDEILALAVRNSNLKALALSFGRAWRAAAELEHALAGMQDSAPAWRARAALLRVQALHAQHVMEKSPERMDALERDMAVAASESNLALALLAPGPERDRAFGALSRHGRITAELTLLSRQNTNVRSLALSLERTPRLLAACDGGLLGIERELRRRLEGQATR